MNIVVKVTNKRIRELIEEAGSGYWAKNLVLRSRGVGFRITENYDGKPKTHVVTAAKVCRGLVKMANAEADEGGWHFNCVRDELKSDMYTGDAVIQFAIFGELKYG